MTQRMSERQTHQSSQHFRRQKITSGYGFSQGLHNARGWAHSQHGQLLQIENTQYLNFQQYRSISAQEGRQPGKTASCSDPVVQCI